MVWKLMLAGFFAMTAALAAHAQNAVTETVETIPSRESYTQTFLFDRVENPVATLVLYSGNKGYVGIYPNGSALFDQFVVYRIRRMLAEQGFNVALLDAPSEWGSRGIWERQRSPEFAAHNAAVLDWLRNRANVPVFLVGASSGGIAATGVATQLKEKGADGLVLLSPWMVSKEKWPIPSFVLSADFAIPSWTDLANIKGPMLLVHHGEDNCNFSLPEYVSGLVDALSVARKPDVITMQGGATPSGNPCYPGGRNNFLGLDRDVADAVGAWVKRMVAKPQ